MLLHLEGRGRLNERLYRALRRAILEGTICAGIALAVDARAGTGAWRCRETSSLMAFAQLVAEGYVDARGGSGDVRRADAAGSASDRARRRVVGGDG